MPSVNERFTATVRDVSTDGRGIIEHPQGQVFFAAGVWPGETGLFVITGFRQRFGFARLLELLEPSADRVVPGCPHHGIGATDCGGCPWQFMAYPAQLTAKEQRVHTAMTRLGVVEQVAPILAAEDIWHYRNRAQLKTDGKQIGYVAAGSNTLAPVNECPILTGKNRATMQALLATLPNPRFKPARKQQWTTLDIDEDVTADAIVPDRRRPFRQGNTAQNEKMKEWLASRIATLDPTRPVLELFAGSGNFTEVLAAAGFTQILAIDSAEDGVKALAARRLPGVEAWLCNLFAEDAYERVRQKNKGASILVLDPPRDGLKNAAHLLTRKHLFRDVFYISCDLATFARDLDIFLKNGFKVVEIQPLDQFPHTPHIELLAWLTR
ncbi:class I SAM-dependent RNA methyltransferase [Kineobactrum sediminis]|uniref:Class I SAM-dependent RNA methyltransferase n=1 Tax=Kineobactrum sediminis TaxID=1905677 RepID=A0A2N5Y1X1_9GAMM|nr:class I SAM-dependent RNA methyltransferase [Kineobactrum sediminis]PLW82369.1 class I SAM-dependent RNA methyltransferase [Kineobactrum sediminis]